MKNQHSVQLVGLTLATLFISTSGALGKYIDMPTPVIIWWRSSLGMLFIYFYCRIKRINIKIHSKRDLLTFIVSSLFLGAHWITYFYALKLSNVALGMLSLFTFPVITALLEPIFIKIKLDPIHIILGFLVLLGIYILAPEINFESEYFKGILLGILSAVFYSIRILILKQHIVSYNGTMLMLYQLVILTIVLLPVLFLMDTSGIKSQYPYVLILALVTTAIGHTLFVKSLGHFKASTASIISSIQPVFGIIIAFFFLKEVPTWSTFFGGLIILSTVIIESMRSKVKK
jgi:drug/metabolite transporter (DMT)-like permease